MRLQKRQLKRDERQDGFAEVSGRCFTSTIHPALQHLAAASAVP
jgi:hypothetical protein